MKSLQLTLLLLSFLFLAVGCGDDDEDMATPTCEQSDWVGDYNGTITCEGEDPEDLRIEITALGTDQVRIILFQPGITTTYNPLTIMSCSINSTASGGGATSTIEASLDGDTFTFTEVIEGGGFDSDCTIVATRAQ